MDGKGAEMSEITLTDEMIKKWLEEIPNMRKATDNYPSLAALSMSVVFEVLELSLRELSALRTRIAELEADLAAKTEAVEELLKTIEPFAGFGNMPNDWPLPDSALICNVPLPDCKNALRVFEKYGSKPLSPSSEEELPTLASLKGIAPDITGSKSSEDFVREHRDNDWEEK
jgi:hypothetical protein